MGLRVSRWRVGWLAVVVARCRGVLWGLVVVGGGVAFPPGGGAQAVLITEICAANDAGLRDADGDASDWLEIYNPGPAPVSLEGWYLTDDPDDLTRWRIPAVEVPGQGFLVAFASGKDRSDPAAALHTNFQLSRDGEFLALVQPDGATVAWSFGAAYPVQVTDVSYGLQMNSAVTEYIAADAAIRWWLPADGDPGGGWTGEAFDDGAWRSGSLAIGYDVAGAVTNPPVQPTYPVADITRPGDVIIATPGDSPAGEEVDKAIDNNVSTKYLNTQELNSGFTVTPSAGISIVTNLRFTSANDAPDRDPASFRLSGSNDGGDYTLIAEGPIPAFPDRFTTVEVAVPGALPYLHYRLIFPTIRGDADHVQIAEVEFGGWVADSGGAPPPDGDVTQPGDPIDPTSFNSPSNEGVVNAIDNNPSTKYLNFDKLDAGFTVRPTVGETVVTGIRFTSANDAPERDPTRFDLSGSNDGVNFVRVAEGPIPDFTARFQAREVALTNTASFTHYRLIFTDVRDVAAAVAVQIAEVELLGTVGPPLPEWDDLLGTNVEAEMYGKETNAYVRIPFTVAPSDPLDNLALQVRYDDGFVAYLNGVEVVRANAPAADRPRTAALRWQRFSLADHAGLVHTGANVLAVYAFNDAAASPEFLFQTRLEDVEVSIGEPGYIELPNPGAVNGGVLLGLAERPVFDPPHGFPDAAIAVTMTTATPGAAIRYTTNGSPPTAATGVLYTGPVPVDRTTVLRAAAFREDWLPSPPATATYLFPDDIVAQTRAGALAAGFPAAWNGQSADYGLDPRVAGPDGTDVFDGKYTAEIRQSLLAIPSLSIAIDRDAMFGPQGIYANPLGRGDAWEREVSIELIDPDRAGGFQQDAGLRIQGGAFRRFDLTLKKSFRVIFRGKYGATELEYPLFGADAADHFDNIVLRANANDAWKWGGASSLYIRDAFAHETLLAMGSVAPHGNFVHLYINGQYWGLYHPVERPDASFSAAYFGGDKETWDAINQDSVPDGTYEAWNRLITLLGQGVPDNAAFQRLQGNNPDGTRNPAYEDLLDVDNMIDYLVMNLYIGNVDWPHRNFWVGRDRNNGDGFKFYSWDSETALGLGSNVYNDRTGVSGAVAQPYAVLRSNAEFRLRFADHVFRHFSEGGALYVNPLAPGWDPARPADNRPAARLAALAEQVDCAIVAESARWGDQLNDYPFTRDEHWRKERDDLLAGYFPVRSATVLQQFRNAGLYPAIDPPVFSHPGGQVEPGFALAMSADGDPVYYTVNGADPRAPGGAVTDGAAAYTGPIPLADLATVKARRYAGGEWSALQEAVFVVGIRRLTLTELNYHPYDPSPDEQAAGFLNDDDFEFLELYNPGSATFDLAGVHFTDGIEFDFTGSAVTRLAPGACVLVVRNPAAFAMRYGTGRPVAGAYAGALSNSGERVALADAAGNLILEVTYGTEAPWPPAADGDGPSLERRDPDGPVDAAAAWRVSPAAGGSPGLVYLNHPVRIAGVARTGDAVQAVFEAEPGRTYVLDFSGALDTGEWDEVMSLTNTPADVPAALIDGQRHGFFRLFELLPQP